MDPRTTGELEVTWDDGKASAFGTDISNAGLLITDKGADASLLGNLKADGFVADVDLSKHQWVGG